jgi:chemotaxis protein histidine kinase CheA
VATAVGCEAPEVDVEGTELAVPPRLHAVLQAALPHLVRNAVVHGLEPADERRAAGKASVGRITVSAREQDGQLEVTIHDDGRGVDRERLLAGARARGLEVDHLPLAELVFEPGVSSRDSVDLDAGRGMGAAAARAAVDGAGGRVEATTELGRGTTFTIRLPIPRR